MCNEVCYQGKKYIISKKDSDEYSCKTIDGTEFIVNKEELQIFLKQITTNESVNVAKSKELVSFYNELIKFNPYQYKPYFRLISENNKRKCVYIADEVGAGKTFEVGIIISELLYSNKIEKIDSILIVSPNMLCRKWQEVLNIYFGFSSKIISKFEEIGSGISIISYDSISRLKENEMKESISLGALIIDEAHNVNEERCKKLLRLRKKSNYSILLSATPLRGKYSNKEVQTKLLFGDENYKISFTEESQFLNRTLKNEMRDRKVNWIIENCEIENKVLMKYIDIVKEIFSGRNTLKKFYGLNMINSSPAAAESYINYLGKLELKDIRELLLGSILVKEDFEDFGYESIDELLLDNESIQEIFADKEEDISEEKLRDIMKSIEGLRQDIKNQIKNDEKLEKLKKIIKGRKVKGNSQDSNADYYNKIVVFVNYKDTVEYLEKNIEESICIDGNINTNEKLKRLNDFKTSDDKNVLIITNIACEGLDMDFCNAIVNYDLTYSPVQLAQRKGRIDRFDVTCSDKYIYNFINKGVDPNNQSIVDNVKSTEEDFDTFAANYPNSIYPILLRKLRRIKKETGIYYNVIDSVGKIYEGDKEENDAKECAIAKVTELFNSSIEHEFGNIDDIQGYYDEIHKKAYEKVNKLLHEKNISVQEENKENDESILIKVNKNNRDFLKYVYDGGTINSHLIYNSK